MKRLIRIGAVVIFFGLTATVSAAKSGVCISQTGEQSIQDLARDSLPQRDGPRTRTGGSVPHVQIGIDPVPEVNQELYRLAFSLPDVEKRPTIVSLPGTDGMWLGEALPIALPKAIVAGREFAHIHTDGSLHAPLPYQRAQELADKGWGERHPWADRRDGWEGLVMIYTPRSMQELKTVFQLIVESYNHITGKSLAISDC